MQRYTPDVYSKDDLADACISQFDVWVVYLRMSTMNDFTMQCGFECRSHRMIVEPSNSYLHP